MQKERFLLAMRVLLMHLLCEKACVLMEPCRLLILPAMKCALQMLVRVRLHLVKRGKMKKTKLNRKKTEEKKVEKNVVADLADHVMIIVVAVQEIVAVAVAAMTGEAVADVNVTRVMLLVDSLAVEIATVIAALVRMLLRVLLIVLLLDKLRLYLLQHLLVLPCHRLEWVDQQADPCLNQLRLHLISLGMVNQDLPLLNCRLLKLKEVQSLTSVKHRNSKRSHPMHPKKGW